MRIGYFDIETSPHELLGFGMFNQNFSLSQLLDSSRMLMFAWQWRGEKPKAYAEWHAGGHFGMLKQLHDLMSEADVVVSYNGSKFDTPVANREFLVAGMGPPDPYHELDLYKTVKRRFKLASNKLDHVVNLLGIGAKESTGGFDLWRKVMELDPAAQRKMISYCKQDTALLEPLHDRLTPWLVGAPNLALYAGEEACPRCGGSDLVKNGFERLIVGTYQRFRCRSCGASSRSGKRLDAVDLRPVT